MMTGEVAEGFDDGERDVAVVDERSFDVAIEAERDANGSVVPIVCVTKVGNQGARPRVALGSSRPIIGRADFRDDFLLEISEADGRDHALYEEGLEVGGVHPLRE